MKRLTKAEKQTLAEEKIAAESFLCSRLKPTGEMEQIPDGKDDIYVQLTFADLKKLLYLHAIDRLLFRIQEMHKAKGIEG